MTDKKRMKSWLNDPVKFAEDVFSIQLDEWQRDALIGISQNQRTAMKASKGVGKEQPVSTIMPTPIGFRKMGDIVSGDFVFASNGKPTRVLNVYPQGVKDVYKVTFDDGSSTECGLEHLWKVRGETEKRHKTWAVLSLKQILERGILKKMGKLNYHQFQIPNCGEVAYKKRKLEVDPYTLGVWLGDGSKNKSQYTSIDLEIKEYIEKTGQNVNILKCKNRTDNFSVNGLLSKLKKIGLSSLCSHERFIPVEYKTAEIEQRKELLKGLMDTDGTVFNGRNSSTSEYNTTSKKLADDVVELVRSLGGKAWIKKTIKRGKYKKDGVLIECRDCYRVTVTTSFCHFKLRRKVNLWKKPSQDRYLCRTIKSVELVRKEESVCIEVEDSDHCYLTNDYIVTHNTALLAIACWWFLATRLDAKIAATSISWDNLADGLWAEMAKWQAKSELLKTQFTWTKTRISSNEKPETWFMSARTWSKSSSPDQQANTLAGLHADNIMFVLDESGGIPSAVMAAAEAALANDMEDHTDAKIIQAGNPTHLSGPLYEASVRDRKMWHVIEISSDPENPKRSPRVSIEWSKQQIEKYGRDNPWVLVNVFGQFPPASLNSLFGYEEVRSAMNRKHSKEDYEYSQKRLGVDVAREGADQTVIFPRQGLVAFKPVVMRGAKGPEVASRIIAAKIKWGGEVEYVDDTGGFGSSVIDNMAQRGHTPQAVHFAMKANNPRYANKRAEMYFRLSEWVKRGGSLPFDEDLLKELPTIEYTFDKQGRLLIEPKEDIKAKLQGASPDKSDALALTFTDEEALASIGEQGLINRIEQNRYVQNDDWDPLDPKRF